MFFIGGDCMVEFLPPLKYLGISYNGVNKSKETIGLFTCKVNIFHKHFGFLCKRFLLFSLLFVLFIFWRANTSIQCCMMLVVFVWPLNDILNEYMNEMNELCFRPQCYTVKLWYTWPGTIRANKIYFGTNHAPVAGSLARSVDLQSNMLPMYHGYPHERHWKYDTLLNYRTKLPKKNI